MCVWNGSWCRMWKFIVPDGTFQNVNLIFPTQQRDVAVLVQKWSQIKQVKKIIIFGSSVTSACNPWSDIDVYVELTEDINLRKPQFDVEIDLWTNYDVDNRLMAEIKEKGVIVYERG